MLKRTIIDHIEIKRDGTIQLRMAKEIVDNDGEVISSGWHRTLVPPDGDMDIQMGEVNLSLTRDLNFPEVQQEEIARVRAVVSVVHTQEVKDAYAAKKEKIKPNDVSNNRNR